MRPAFPSRTRFLLAGGTLVALLLSLTIFAALRRLEDQDAQSGFRAAAQERFHALEINVDQALDNIVRWMISPNPADRPIANQLLQTVGVQWAESRRRAGATVFEGNWGPADEILAEDAEMIDV